MREPSHVAVGTWSGGRFMHFGEPVSEERFVSLLRPSGGIDTVLTADAYGAGAADSLLGQAVDGVPRDSYCLVGAVGHDFYNGERQGAKGFPRFTDASLRTESEYADYLRKATEQSLQRIGTSSFDLLLLHNPDRTGFTSEAVWDGMSALVDAGLTAKIGIAPGPANGFTLDLIDCFERFGDRIDWAMVILNPLEPWPGELVLPAALEHDVKLIARVVDYGGLFHGDVKPGHDFPRTDHRGFRPEGWVERGTERISAMLPIAERHGLTPLQLACQWDLANAPIACVAPTLIQEQGSDAKSIESKREELAAVPREVVLTSAEVEQIRELGDNRNSMRLKGASPDNAQESRADAWNVDSHLVEVAGRWSIDPERDLTLQTS